MLAGTVVLGQMLTAADALPSTRTAKVTGWPTCDGFVEEVIVVDVVVRPKAEPTATTNVRRHTFPWFICRMLPFVPGERGSRVLPNTKDELTITVLLSAERGQSIRGQPETFAVRLHKPQLFQTTDLKSL
jgi:hypothetical protein